MRERQGILHNIDWITVLLFLLLAFIGWINVYSAVYNEDHSSIFDFSQRYGKQLIWIFAAIGIALIIIIIDASFFTTFASVSVGYSTRFFVNGVVIVNPNWVFGESYKAPSFGLNE